MSGLLARMWRRLRGPVQWYVLWIFYAKFMIGVTGLVRDRDGRVLLLRHRMWPSGQQWGLPTGYARKRERFEDTVVREVKEESGLDVTVGPARSGHTVVVARVPDTGVGRVVGMSPHASSRAL
jgi:8-oxo-dGTP diphosphatase